MSDRFQGEENPPSWSLSISALAVYGIYAFAIRGLWKYLFLQQPFFFFDTERGYALFFADYIAIVVLFAMVVHYVAKLMKA